MGLAIVPLAVFVLGFSGTWNLREAFNEMIWFSAAWLGALAVIYGADMAGFGFLSTSPTGPGGGVAFLIGFAAMYYRRRKWKQEQVEKQRRMAEARARRAQQGIPEPTFLSNMGRAVSAARQHNRE